MGPDDFALFYKAVHEHEPFPWQARLARQVAQRGWPEVLALPTAAGKTAAIDIAVFALALQAGRPQAERTAPLRVFFVIDRRLVVDQAARHARELQWALQDPTSEAVREVAEALGRYGGQGPLHVAAMRGGMYRDDSWAQAPNQPTVCVSTVDQVGSRLLFRGYGVGEFARPVHAALAGNDALYLVDEAHLSVPFLQTLHAVKRYRAAPWAACPVGGPFEVVDISATSAGEGERFILVEEDHANEELARRLDAPKPARLVEASKFEEDATALAGEALKGDARVVGVVVNRVASARAIFNRLKGKEFEDKVLLTGRIRPWDRDALLSQCLGRMKAGRTRDPADPPLVGVATMTVEVGADLDFDHLVTEAAPLPALRQRFGRLDRLGRFGRAQAVILLRKAKGPDPVYGDDLAAAWQWLKARAAESGGVDFGVTAFERLREGATEAPPQPVAAHAPALLPAHLDALAQTSPAPRPSPDVAPFLHGAEALEAADVQVVWRADLRADNEGDWAEVVAAAPPRSREALPLPVAAVRRWLSGEDVPEVADLEGVGDAGRPTRQGRACLRWRGPEAAATGVVGPQDIAPGDTLVVPAEYGGADEFGWDPECDRPVEDVGDLCVNDMANNAPDDGGKRLIRLRLHEGLLSWLPPEEGQASPAALARQVGKLLADGEDYDLALKELLDALRERSPFAPLLNAVLRQLAEAPRVTAYPAGIILTGRAAPGFHREEPPDEAEADEQKEDGTDDDDTSSVRAGTLPPAKVELTRHAEGVARWVEAFAARLGLDEATRATLSRAAHLHDIGKADWRFQYLLYGGEPDDVLLAKSEGEWSPAQFRLVRKSAGLPEGFRHEFVSVALLRANAGHLLEGLDSESARLAEYLIGTHHGRGRPFPPAIEEDGQEVVSLDWGGHELSASANHGLWRLDSGWVDRFWELLRRHGYWGLAFLEACLRLADHARSREEQSCPTTSS
jgi:CRISPR-associated endonuclease/helicase Cas3